MRRLGAEAALRSVVIKHGASVWSDLPVLWSLCSAPVVAASEAIAAETPALAGGSASGSTAAAPDPQQVVQALQVLLVVGPHLVPELLGGLEDLMPHLSNCCR